MAVECEFSWQAQHLVMSHVKRLNHENEFSCQAQSIGEVGV